MSYNDNSTNGDEIVDLFLDYIPNIWTPPTPTGDYCYNILGCSWDRFDDELRQVINDHFILSASTKALDKYYGKFYGIKREEGWDDKVYASVLFVNSVETITVYGLKKCLASVFDCEYDDFSVNELSEDVFTFSDDFNEFDSLVDDFTENETDKTFMDNLPNKQGRVIVTFPKEYDTKVNEVYLSELISPYLAFGNIILMGGTMG